MCAFERDTCAMTSPRETTAVEAADELLDHMVDWANCLHHRNGIGVIFDNHTVYLARRYAALKSRSRVRENEGG